MDIKFIERNLFDVFFGEGFKNYVRFRKTSHGLIIYKRGGKLPENYIDLVELKLYIQNAQKAAKG